MAIYPVILCGGSGTRLWPASRPSRPKQFLDLVGDLSLFQDTVRRVAPLAEGGGELVVVAGVDHEPFVLEQLSTIGVSARVLLEPTGRDSAPAMAAAAQLIERLNPAGVALFVASDHYIPEQEEFRSAVLEAYPPAQAGRIVTFGVRPTEPSSAYGYINPEHEGLSPVRRFVEKPDRQTAERYVREGYLWNSGNFMVAAGILLSELRAHAPDIAENVEKSLPEGALAPVIRLDGPFSQTRKLSIDYAVMERSENVSVLPVSFSWSDLGAWDAVATIGSGTRGVWIGQDGDSCLVRAAEGIVVATAGVSGVAIIAEHDAVLVCSLDRAQEVKGLVDRLADLSPSHVGRGKTEDRFDVTARRFFNWMNLAALPLWATLGVDEDGAFLDALDARGKPVGDFRRARVQGRQAYVYAAAGKAGWSGPWKRLVRDGLAAFEATNLRQDGLYRTRVGRDGDVLDDTPWLYDQAFVLFALAAAAAAGIEPEANAARAHRLFEALETLRHPAGGWREAGEHPFQANAHMHLLEACMAWEALEPGGDWTRHADAIVGMARAHFIDAEGGFLREFFDANWKPASGEDGRLVEPGHQFEWAWLLTRWGGLRGDAWALEAAQALYRVGARGVDVRTGIAMDALNDDLSVRSAQARLWPQTERLKAALILAEAAGEGDRPRYVRDAHSALKGLMRYLEPSGLWRDKLTVDGAFIAEPSPASSLYHIMVACEQLRALEVRLSGWGG